MHSPAAPASPPSAATGHGKGIVSQGVFQPGRDNLVQVPRYEGNDLDAVTGHDGMHGPGDGAAHEGAYSQLHQPQRLVYRKILRQGRARFVQYPSRPDISGISDINDVKLAGGVENRRDPVVPDREGCFHYRTPFFIPTFNIANGGPEATSRIRSGQDVYM